MSRQQTSSNTVPLVGIGIFLIFGACMAAFAATTLLWPGTLLDNAWRLNPAAYAQLSTRRNLFALMFAGLSFALGCSAIGWFRRRRWGWALAVIIISIQVAGDFGNLVRGDLLRGSTGVLIAGALLAYMCRPAVRNEFY